MTPVRLNEAWYPIAGAAANNDGIARVSKLMRRV